MFIVARAIISVRKRPLIMSDFRREGRRSKMTPKNRTLEGKNQTLDDQKNRTSFVDVPDLTILARSFVSISMPVTMSYA